MGDPEESLLSDSASKSDTNLPATHHVGLMAIAVSMAAFLLAAVSAWVAPAFEPEPVPLDEAAVDFVIGFKEKLNAKLDGKPVPKVEPATEPTNWYPVSVVAVGALGVCLGVISFVRHEDTRISLAAVLLGISAMLIQFLLVLATAILAILLIGVVLSFFGIILGGAG